MRPSIHCAIAGLLAATPLAACTTIQAIEPVTTPPATFRSDTLTNIEFLAPFAIGVRCAERGARVMGLPALNSGACADATLITMIDPCLTVTAGAYARDLCDGIEAHKAWASSPGTRVIKASDPTRIDFTIASRQTLANTKLRQETMIAVAFVSEGDLGIHCNDGSGREAKSHASCFRAGIMFAANPCARLDQGWFERLLCHELGHVNGWAANHDGGALRPALRLASESPEARALKPETGRATGNEASFAQNAP